MTQFDFDLHGFFRLRLVDATEREAAVVTRQLGPIQTPVASTPDLTIRFVESLPAAPEMRFIGLNDAAHTERDYYILKGKQKSTVRVLVPFDKIGGKAEMVAERGINNIPLLIPIVNLTMLAKGILPFHASAFTYKGKGALITGWAKGGKTEVLLSFMAKGANYVGDEWVYLCPDGKSMFGIPEPIRVWDWHLGDLPEFRARMKKKDRMRMQSLGVLSQSLDALSGPVKLLRRVNPMVRRQMYVHFPPHKLFGKEHMQQFGTIDRVIFAASHNSPEIVVQPHDPLDVARRMVYSLAEEQLGFTSAYLKYRFAFPDRQNDWIEDTARVQKALLEKALAGKQTVSVLHPYPVHIPSLFTALEGIF